MYHIVCEYIGHEPDFDRKLEAAVGRSSDGSGYGLMDGMRDLCWYRKTKKAAERIAAVLRRFHRLTKVEVFEDKD